MVEAPTNSASSHSPHPTGRFGTLCDVATGVALTVFSTYLLALALMSLSWRMVHDAPNYAYIGYLMQHLHYVPYRDIFEVNPPGICLLNQAYVSIFGYDDLGFRIADLIWLGAILTTTWFWLRQVGRRIAWGAVVLFGVEYLGFGSVMSMQRDYLAILPISAAILVASSLPKLNEFTRYLGIGVLFGMASTIKPHAAIGLPAVLCLGLFTGEARGVTPGAWAGRIRASTVSIVGFAIPIVGVMLYLLVNGALPAFWEIATRSWPHYVQLTGNLSMAKPGFGHITSLVRGYMRFGGQVPWLFAGLAGVFVVLDQPTLPKTSRVLVIIMALLTLLYGIYPVFSGKFWPYHWIIFTYMAITLGSLCLVLQPSQIKRSALLGPLLLIALTAAVQVHAPREFWFQIKGLPPAAPKGGRVDEIAEFLRSHLRPMDRVQPLDWTGGGVVQAMLMVRARVATRYLYDEEFYHHVSTPYVKKLRREFVRDLQASKARFIIEVTMEDKPWVSGRDTTREFPELQQLLKTEYSVVLQGNGYLIHERRLNRTGIPGGSVH